MLKNPIFRNVGSGTVFTAIFLYWDPLSDGLEIAITVAFLLLMAWLGYLDLRDERSARQEGPAPPPE